MLYSPVWKRTSESSSRCKLPQRIFHGFTRNWFTINVDSILLDRYLFFASSFSFSNSFLKDRFCGEQLRTLTRGWCQYSIENYYERWNDRFARWNHSPFWLLRDKSVSLRGKDSLNDINVIKQKTLREARIVRAAIQKLDNIRKLFTTMRDIRSDSSRNSVIHFTIRQFAIILKYVLTTLWKFVSLTLSRLSLSTREMHADPLSRHFTKSSGANLKCKKLRGPSGCCLPKVFADGVSTVSFRMRALWKAQPPRRNASTEISLPPLRIFSE